MTGNGSGKASAPPVSLLPEASLNFLNTLAVPAKADYLAEVDSVAALRAALQWWRTEHPEAPLLPLGGGSNLVLAADFAGLVLRIGIEGRRVVQEDEEFVWIEVGAGENWHQLVQYCMHSHYWGLENLALIPGSVGAAPIQNIGAYGVELCDYFVELSALEIDTGVVQTFDREDCGFGYRDSVFKGRLQGRYIITSVTLKLCKQPQLHCHYPALQHYFQDLGETVTGPEQVFDAVCAIRQSKLPDPRQVPNVGSFFQNPLVDADLFLQLQQRFPRIVGYPVETGVNSGRVKLAAGWLIDTAGWRGYRDGAVGVHDRQALVLINPGHGSGREVLQLAKKIQADILDRYGVTLVIEPSVVGV